MGLGKRTFIVTILLVLAAFSRKTHYGWFERVRRGHYWLSQKRGERLNALLECDQRVSNAWAASTF